MSIKTGNGVLNFFYRIFIDVEEVDDTQLRSDSSDPIERTLAESDKDTDEKYRKHFAGSNAGNVKNQLKVDESELNKDEKATNTSQKQKEEDLER